MYKENKYLLHKYTNLLTFSSVFLIIIHWSNTKTLLLLPVLPNYGYRSPTLPLQLQINHIIFTYSQILHIIRYHIPFFTTIYISLIYHTASASSLLNTYPSHLYLLSFILWTIEATPIIHRLIRTSHRWFSVIKTAYAKQIKRNLKIILELKHLL